MSNSWSKLPSAPRRGSSKVYKITEQDTDVLVKAFAKAQAELTKMMGPDYAVHLVNSVKNGFNFETLDEGFEHNGVKYTILSMSHKGQSAGDMAWTSLEPHVGMRGIAFFIVVVCIQQSLQNNLIMPHVSTWDTMADGKVISVTRCHFTPNGRPLGVCRKEDRKASPTPVPVNAPAASPGGMWGVPPANAWGSSSATTPAGANNPAPF